MRGSGRGWRHVATVGASGASAGGLALPRFWTSGLQAWEGTGFFSEPPGLGHLSQETDRVGEGMPGREPAAEPVAPGEAGGGQRGRGTGARDGEAEPALSGTVVASEPPSPRTRALPRSTQGGTCPGIWPHPRMPQPAFTWTPPGTGCSLSPWSYGLRSATQTPPRSSLVTQSRPDSVSPQAGHGKLPSSLPCSRSHRGPSGLPSQPLCRCPGSHLLLFRGHGSPAFSLPMCRVCCWNQHSTQCIQ